MSAYTADQWRWANADPTAGVRLMPSMRKCPRCGVTKGRVSQTRPGLCADCRAVLTPDERLEWAS